MAKLQKAVVTDSNLLLLVQGPEKQAISQGDNNKKIQNHNLSDPSSRQFRLVFY